MADVKVHVEVNEPALNRQTQTHLRRRMRSLRRRIATQARVDVPVRTGNLGRGIKEGPDRFSGPRTIHSDVHDNVDYAAPVHEGARPHIIRPLRAKALRFQVGGRTVYTTLVRHPGNKGRPFLRNAGLRVAAQEAARR